MTPYTGSQAQAGRGSQLFIGASPILVGELKTIPLNRGKWNSVDVSNFQSAADVEKLVTMRESADIDIGGNFIGGDAGQQALEAAYQSGELTAFQIVLPPTPGQVVGRTYNLNAFVLDLNLKVETTAAIDFTANLQTSGPTTVIPGH